MGWVGLGFVGMGWVGLGFVGMGWVLLDWVIGVYHHYQILFGYIVTTRFNGRENTDSYTFSVLN
jgi:hypothetical protein